VTHPCMNPEEIVFIKDYLKNNKVEYVLEYGSGNSTLEYPQCVTYLKLWRSIEHNKDWYERTKKNLTDSRVSLNFVPPNNEEWILNGNFEAFRDYVLFPLNFKEKYDLIIVDGYARVECLFLSKYLVRKNGKIFLHDFIHAHYNPGINSLNRIKSVGTLLILEP